MSKVGTSQIVLESINKVTPHYRNIRNVSDFQKIFPFRTIGVKDEVSSTCSSLPEGYIEDRLYLMDRSLQLATIDLAYHAEYGLVNFSLFVIPREWFKRRTINNCVRDIFLFLRSNYPDTEMLPVTSNNFLFPDPSSGLTFQVRPNYDRNVCFGIGIAIIDSNHI